mmetsp:Transcript_8484/g.20441  ORF Transcript_8484/g.20441 Transcript_8484/m.20441 type:complete len:304 (-) Transcript_8484:121-1032(-)
MLGFSRRTRNCRTTDAGAQGLARASLAPAPKAKVRPPRHEVFLFHFGSFNSTAETTTSSESFHQSLDVFFAAFFFECDHDFLPIRLFFLLFRRARESRIYALVALLPCVPYSEARNRVRQIQLLAALLVDDLILVGQFSRRLKQHSVEQTRHQPVLQKPSEFRLARRVVQLLVPSLELVTNVAFHRFSCRWSEVPAVARSFELVFHELRWTHVRAGDAAFLRYYLRFGASRLAVDDEFSCRAVWALCCDRKENAVCRREDWYGFCVHRAPRGRKRFVRNVGANLFLVVFVLEHAQIWRVCHPS